MQCSTTSCQLVRMRMTSGTYHLIRCRVLSSFVCTGAGWSRTYLHRQVQVHRFDLEGGQSLSRSGRKRSAPSAYADHMDYDSSGQSHGTRIKSIAQSKSHLFMLCEAQRFRSQSWASFNSGDGRLDTCRGSHNHLPLAYMIVEIIHGKTIPLGTKGTGVTSLMRPVYDPPLLERALTVSAFACST